LPCFPFFGPTSRLDSSFAYSGQFGRFALPFLLSARRCQFGEVFRLGSVAVLFPLPFPLIRFAVFQGLRNEHIIIRETLCPAAGDALAFDVLSANLFCGHDREICIREKTSCLSTLTALSFRILGAGFWSIHPTSLK
jgi:hypothetical protein